MDIQALRLVISGWKKMDDERLVANAAQRELGMVSSKLRRSNSTCVARRCKGRTPTLESPFLAPWPKAIWFGTSLLVAESGGCGSKRREAGAGQTGSTVLPTPRRFEWTDDRQTPANQKRTLGGRVLELF